jgi:ribonuclease D
MKEPSKDTIHYINSKSGLSDIIFKLQKEPILAFDLEADSMYHFQEKVCLIQAGTPEATYIIDPLPIKDLSQLAKIFSDPDIKKIFHGADYDVRSLFRDYQITINNLFDTEIASRFLGNAETGLGAVLKNRFDIILEKKFQKKDWSQRPLPNEMITYAAKDVQFLIALYKIQKKELAEKGRLDWVKEECRALTEVRPPEANERPLFVRIKGSGRLDRRELAVLEALLEFRIHIAEQKDRPLFKVISNAALSKLAATRPKTAQQLNDSSALSPKQINMYGTAIIKIIKTALKIPADALPVYPRTHAPRLSHDASSKFKELKTWREEKAQALEIDPGVLINNAALKSIAESNPKNITSLDAIPALKSWQKKELSKSIINYLVKP